MSKPKLNTLANKAQLEALIAQRGELLAALKDILKFVAPPISGSSARRLACVRARAAIANCKTTYQVMEAAERPKNSRRRTHASN